MEKIDKTKIEKESIEWYIKNQGLFRLLGLKVDNILKELIELEGIPYHAIFNRVKEIESFSKKLLKKGYPNGHDAITDLSGIRIITYVESQIEPICNLIDKNFEVDKDKSNDKSEELGIDKVGYKSVHFVAQLKSDRLILPEYNRFENKYFEIQVRTILQHAWAEIEHDRNYKFSGILPKDIQRRFKLLAGMLESADREFNLISNEIDKISREVEIATKKGELDIPINSTSIKQYLNTKFDSLFQSGATRHFIDSKRELTVLSELEKFGIKTLEDLDSLVPNDFIEKQIRSGLAELSNFTAILIDIMVISDYKKYFESVWNKNHWIGLEKASIRFYEMYHIPIMKIINEKGIDEID